MLAFEQKACMSIVNVGSVTVDVERWNGTTVVSLTGKPDESERATRKELAVRCS
jgi:hypothetical protein